MTTLSITPTTGKWATVIGDVAVRELVAVTLVGLGARIPEGLVLRVLAYNGNYAVCEQWTPSGTAGADATGMLNLNTDPLVVAMKGYPQGRKRVFPLELWSLSTQNVIVDTTLSIRANHMSDHESFPQPVAPWGTDLTPLNAAVTALQTLLGSHAHNGTDSAHVSHLNLTDIGINSHAAIDAALLNLQASINVHADRLAALEAWQQSVIPVLAGVQAALAALAQWRPSVDADIAQVLTEYGAMSNQLAALRALAPTNLGWSVGNGTILRAISGDNPAYNELVHAVRTLIADLKGRGVI